MGQRRTWATVASTGVAVVTLAGAALVVVSARGGGSVEVAAGAAPTGAATRDTLVAADDRGRIVELAADDGSQLAVLADETVTGGSVGGLTRADGGADVFFATHDPLVGLPCDSTVVRLSLDGGQATTIGSGFAPALSPDGARLAYVATESHPSGCSYAARVRELATGAETSWGLDANWAGHYGMCSLTWDPSASALVAELCHGADTVLHRVDLDGSEAIGDATYLGPRNPEASWAAAAPGPQAETVVAVERCCLSGSPLQPSHRLVVVDTASGEVGEVLGQLPGTIESVAHTAARSPADLVLVAFTFQSDGSTERQLLRWTDGGIRPLGRGLVSAAW